SELDAPLTPSMKGDRAVAFYLRHITKEDRIKEREEVLSTTEEDIKNYAKMMKDIMNKNFYTVLGNDNKIKANSSLFNNLENVFK
ncbi:MAG TPA: hypothetical protein DCL31_11815, partial [Clostridium sp.]|nr:hypothetical protein [Clostridium sp.]